MRLAAGALVAAALLAPSVAAAPATAPRVVGVRTASGDAATGFVVGRNRIVTVSHVLDGGGDVLVDGRRAIVVRRDDRLDLAVLAVAGVRGAPLRLSSGAGGGTVLGRPARVVRRADARIDGSAWRRPLLELRADVAAGDSGAPVVSAAGRLVGVVFARSRGRPAVAYATDAAALPALLG